MGYPIRTWIPGITGKNPQFSWEEFPISQRLTGDDNGRFRHRVELEVQDPAGRGVPKSRPEQEGAAGVPGVRGLRNSRQVLAIPVGPEQPDIGKRPLREAPEPDPVLLRPLQDQQRVMGLP